jgi:hypothetical protein
MYAESDRSSNGSETRLLMKVWRRGKHNGQLQVIMFLPNRQCKLWAKSGGDGLGVGQSKQCNSYYSHNGFCEVDVEFSIHCHTHFVS